MNVIGTRPDGWWKDRRSALVRLVEQLERWADAEGQQVTVVFEQPPSPPVPSAVVAVAHPPRAKPNSADDEIVRLLEVDARPQEITVVSSDSALAERVRSLGASVYPAGRFRDVIDSGTGNARSCR